MTDDKLFVIYVVYSISLLNALRRSLECSNKAALFHYLQAKFPDTKIIKSPRNTALILDGMEKIQ